MVIERLGFEKILEKLWKPVANIYTMLIVMFAWVLFRSNTLNNAINYWKAMFTFQFTDEQHGLFMNYINTEFISALIIALVGSFGLFSYISTHIENSILTNSTRARIVAYSYHSISLIFYITVFLLCTMYLTAGTYNPFIYYRF